VTRLVEDFRSKRHPFFYSLSLSSFLNEQAINWIGHSLFPFHCNSTTCYERIY